MDIILITNIDMPENIRNWLRKNYVADAVGALEVLQKVQNQTLEKPKDVSANDIAAQMTAIEKLLGLTQGFENNTEFEPPPMGVIMQNDEFSAQSKKKEIDDE